MFCRFKFSCWNWMWMIFLTLFAVLGDQALGLSFESNGTKYSFPKKVVIQRNGETLFTSSKPKSWNEESDRAFRFRFETHDFLLVGTWDSGDFTTYRLFHLGALPGEIKQYTFMSAVEDDDVGEFFAFDGKLYYWESKFCAKKTALIFEPSTLEFKEYKFKDVPKGGCLTADGQLAKRKYKIEWKKLSDD